MTARKNNSLSGEQKFQLANYIKDNKETLFGKDRPKIAVSATEALGFNVSVSNVEYAANMSGQDWAKSNKGRQPQKLVKTLAWKKVNSDLRSLARAHLELCEQLDTKTRHHENIKRIALKAEDSEQEDA